MLKHVYIWPNQMVMAFDENGEQLPEFQGYKEEALPKIIKWIEENPFNQVVIEGADKTIWRIE